MRITVLSTLKSYTHDYDSFARSMNNCDYAATQLQYYGLKPNSAENDGSGTVWTHAAISRWLGGTDHADPHGYLHNNIIIVTTNYMI